MNSFSFAGERSRPPTRSRRSAELLGYAGAGRATTPAGGLTEQLRDRLGRLDRRLAVALVVGHGEAASRFPVTGRRALTSGGPAAAWRRWRCAFRAGPRSSPFPGVWGIFTRCIARGANGHRRWHTAGVGECGCSTLTPRRTLRTSSRRRPPEGWIAYPVNPRVNSRRTTTQS